MQYPTSPLPLPPALACADPMRADDPDCEFEAGGFHCECWSDGRSCCGCQAGHVAPTPVATPRDAAVARVRQTLGHAFDKLEAVLGADVIGGEDALDLARAVAAVGRVRERLGGASS